LRVSVTPWPHITPGKEPVPIVHEAGWASGPVWTGAEKLAPPGFDPRTFQPVAQLLYRLSYRAHLKFIKSAILYLDIQTDRQTDRQTDESRAIEESGAEVKVKATVKVQCIQLL
jgi:hypothetical protein